jgi:hypothetical protein
LKTKGNSAIAVSKVLEAQLKNSQAELAAATEGRQKVKGKYNVLCNALVTAVETMLREMPTFMTAYGLTASDLSTESLDMNQFFDWLRTCLAMLDARSKLYGDLSAVVTARILAASVCNILPTEADSPQTLRSDGKKLFVPRTFSAAEEYCQKFY